MAYEILRVAEFDAWRPGPLARPQRPKYGVAVGSFDELAQQTMPPASRLRAKKRADAILERMTLGELRKSRKITQERVASAMKLATERGVSDREAARGKAGRREIT